MAPSRNTICEIRTLIEEIQELFNESITSYNADLVEEYFYFSPLEQEKYGDYVSINIFSICERLRRLDPHFFRHSGPQDIAQNLLKAVNSNPKSEMIEELCTHDVGYLTFKLSWEWMAKRIQMMLNDGVSTWAPKIVKRSAVVDSPTPAIGAEMHADVIRSGYIRDMLIHMLEYSGVAVYKRFWTKKSMDAVRTNFTERRGVISSRNKATPLFKVKGEELNNVYDDLRAFWSAVHEQGGELIVYVSPVRQRGYVEKCFSAVTNEKCFPDECTPIVLCCGYRTSSSEQEKLAYLWSKYESHSKAASLVKLGEVAGYTAEASFECALKYTYLKTHRLAECTFNIDEMLDEEGNTFLYLLKTRDLVSSLIKKFGSRGTVKYTKTAIFGKERELALHLVRFTEVIEKACLTFLLHPVCEYLWNLCKKVSSFHHEESSRVSSRDTLPKNLNPRFELFCMNVHISHSSFKKGYVFGNVSLKDTDGLVSDRRLPVDKNDHGHVSYFYHDWNDKIGICNNAYLFFGNPSPRGSVSFSSVIEIYAILYATTLEKDKCFQICKCQTPIDLSKFWAEGLNYKRSTLTIESKDGCILIDYIMLRDAVDTAMELRFESPDDPLIKAPVSGHIFAYYGDGVLDDCDDFRQHCYKAVVFHADGNSAVEVGPLTLKRSVLAVPANGYLMIEALFVDVNSGKIVFKRKKEFPAKTHGFSKYRMPLKKNCFFNLTLEWSQGPKSSYS
ncbi:arginine--tRNA ligase, chloroplastic/mitochondrial [Tanacetum coccineum]